MTASEVGPQVELAPRLIERARRGDEEAFAALIRHYDSGLRALAYRLLGDRSRMDDALQEAYVKAYRALPDFRGAARLGTWLYRIAYNACMDELRRGPQATQVALADTAEPEDPAPGPPEQVAFRQELSNALAALSPADRAAVLLIDLQGFSYEEAGDVLGIATGTVASRLNRARAALRSSLGDRDRGAAGE
jgi:RNA polymerase sigma-70 factor (ECF subfamily)